MATLIKILDNAKFLSKTVLGEVSSPAPQPPTYAIGRSLSAVNEGSSVTFTLSTTNVANGTLVPYTISGISSTDVTTGSLTGSFIVNSGLATATITMSADQLTEGAETATLTLNNAAASNFVLVNDTSTTPPVPLTVSGLQLWLDAADSSTLFDATAGGNLVTTDGAAVARWADKSGLGNHATQTTANARPLLKTNIKNGRNVIRFDGQNDVINAGGNLMRSAHTMFIVVNNLAKGRGYHNLFFGITPNINGLYYGMINNSAPTGGTPNKLSTGRKGVAADAQESGTTSFGTYALFSATRSGTASTLFKNGSQVGVNSNWTYQIDGDQLTTIGCENLSSSNPLYGDVSEILIYNAALTTTQRQAVETYLNTKWALY